MAGELAPVSPQSARRIRGPTSAAGWVLLALVLLGIALRILAIVSWWPVTPTLEDGYQRFAAINVFIDPQHPVGYDLIVAGLGAITRQVAFTVLVQHLAGLASALLFGAATRRVTGSAWARLLPAGIVLLDPDVVFLEHSIMSEIWVILAIAFALYGAVRVAEEPVPWWRWPLLTGAALAAAVMIRSAALPLVAVVALALLLVRPRRVRATLVVVGTSLLLLLAFAGLNAVEGQRFGIEPSPGWYLYGRVAQFADCRRFTPPARTARLCETRPLSQRPTAYFYTFESGSPAVKLFGAFGSDDATVGGWARRALEAQPGAFLRMAWVYLRGYFVPGSLPRRISAGSTGLDPQLDFANPGNPFIVAAIQQDLERYYYPFKTHTLHVGLRVLRAWQRVVRFGATALFVATLLTAVGLAVGPRRYRVGALMFGVGGLSLLLAPALTGTYSGRYTVPMAGSLAASAAIALTALWRGCAPLRGTARAVPASVPPAPTEVAGHALGDSA
jgi:hypothetical protein